MKNVLQSLLLLLATAGSFGLRAQTLPDSQWVNLGPKGGSISGLEIDFQNPSTLYARIDSGHVFVSTDGGETWNPFPNTTGYAWFNDFKVSPKNSNVLYGQATKIDPGSGTWLSKYVRSVNQGSSWRDIPQMPQLFSPSSTDTSYITSSFNDTLKISTDGGMSYSAMRKLPFSVYQADGVIAGTNPNIMLLRSSWGTVWRSTDAGHSWNRVMLGSDSLVATSLAGRINNGSIMYAINTPYGSASKLHITRDNGASWDSISLAGIPTLFQVNAIFAAPGDTATLSLWISKTDPSIFSAIVRTTNNGQTWTELPLEIFGELAGVANHSTNANIGYIVNAGKILKTTDGGQTWLEKDDGILAQIINRIETQDNANTIMFTGNSRIYGTLDQGQTWTDSLVREVGWSGSVFAAPSTGKYYYLIGNQVDTIYKTTDAGTTWSKVGTGLVGEYFNSYFTLPPFVVHPTDPQTLFYASSNWNKSYKSTDGGQTWTQLDSMVINGLTVALSNQSIIYGVVGITSAANPNQPTSVLRKSIDGGATWSTLASGLPPPPTSFTSPYFSATDIMVSPSDANVLLLGGVYRTSSTDSLRIYRSTDGGGSWTIMRTGVPLKFPRYYSNDNTITFAVNKYNPNEIVGTSPALDRPGISEDGGLTWEGFPKPYVGRTVLCSRIVRYNNQDVLLAGTQAGSLIAYKLHNISVGVREKSEPVPGRFGLSQNYPNPFNPSTRIEYEIAKQGDVEIAIYDIAGRLVKTLLHSYQYPGSHVLQWDGKDAGGITVTSGVYFYRFSSNGNQVSRKMLLLR